MAELRRRLPARWRIAAAAVILAAGALATSEVHRKHGVPLFLAAIGCGAVLRSWALGIYVVGVLGFAVEQAITGRGNFSPSGSGDDLGAYGVYGLLLYLAVGAIAILIGIALAALARVHRPPDR